MCAKLSVCPADLRNGVPKPYFAVVMGMIKKKVAPEIAQYNWLICFYNVAPSASKILFAISCV